MQVPHGFFLFKDGKSDHVIVLLSSASPSEKTAAKELQDHLQACTGVKLTIVDKEPTSKTPMIVLGRNTVAQKHGVSPSDADLGEQGYQLFIKEPHIFIAGTAGVGTLNGTYRFIEDRLGVRWYATGATRTPRVKSIYVLEEDRVVKPAFELRETSYWALRADKVLSARLGFNAGSAGKDGTYGAQYSVWGRDNTYFNFVPPNTYFAQHPEYFSEINGTRRGVDSQLCLTNPEVLAIVKTKMLDTIKKNPSVRVFGISQMDTYNYCQCSKCLAMYKQYKTTGGAHYWFANEVAKEVAKTYPEVLINAKAYIYTEKPPTGLPLEPNLAIWLGHMYPSCDSHPITSCTKNAEYKANAKAWAKLTKHLFVRHYIVDFAHYYVPFPNLDAMAQDMKFYRDIGVKGVQLLAMGSSGGGGGLSLLRSYLGMKLLWDPDQDAEAIIKDFLEGYYGAASKPIWDYVSLLHDKVKKESIHMHLYTNPSQGYLTDAVIKTARGYFDKAQSAVSTDQTRLERVRVARMPLQYAQIFPRAGYSIAGDHLTWPGIAPFSMVTDFVNRMMIHGFKTVSETVGSYSNFAMVAALLQIKQEVVTLSNSAIDVDVIPFLGGRIARITDRKTKKNVTAFNVTRALTFPFQGGMEVRIGTLFKPRGMESPAIVTSKTRSSITLTGSTMNGYTLTRYLKLDATKPLLHVTERVTNSQTSSKQTSFRSHLELNLGTLSTTTLHFTDLSAKAVKMDMKEVIAGKREGVHFYLNYRPSGSWTFSGDSGLKVIQRFKNSQLDYAWVFAYPEEDQMLEVELWANEKLLAPGESLSLEMEIEVQPS